MTYARYIGATEVAYPDYSKHPFAGVPNARTNDALHRLQAYLPLVGEHTPPEGHAAVPTAFALVAQTETRTEPRAVEVPDYDPDTHEQTGSHTEWRDTEVTKDTSYITVTAWEDVPEPSPEARTVCTKYELVACLSEHYPELLETLRAEYAESADLQFYWNTVIKLDRNNADFKVAVGRLDITDDQLDEIFSKIEPVED